MLDLMFFLTVRSLWVASVTCIQLFSEIVSFHAKLCWRFISWTVSIATLPVRALCALQRERMTGRLLEDMQYELENLSWKNENLESRLKMAMKERSLMESILAEIEEEHDVAIGKIERLEKEADHLKDENLRLRESQAKDHWDSSVKDNIGNEDVPIAGTVSGPTNSKQLGIPVTHKSHRSFQPRRGNPTGLVDPLTPLVFSSSVNGTDLALDQRREVAIFQSVFSALLSLLVGAIIWEAKDPCMPLVMALFSVVGLSLRSVVQFFSTIKNKPASNAVALLSFNWFILGTLTYPSLPRVARMVSPVVDAFLKPILRRVGLGSP